MSTYDAASLSFVTSSVVECYLALGDQVGLSECLDLLRTLRQTEGSTSGELRTSLTPQVDPQYLQCLLKFDAGEEEAALEHISLIPGTEQGHPAWSWGSPRLSMLQVYLR